ncbi:MAG: hypothetical protein M1565_04390 [Actinobacteria bacterium]|nr:hypothetical protein [Actinomycetota bacterium]MCL5735214.1 hypothetical protein [Actinomycetota bacterium]
MSGWIGDQMKKAEGVVITTAVLLILLRIALNLIAPVLPYVFLLIVIILLIVVVVLLLRRRRDRW